MSKTPNLILLGNLELKRLPIFSFLVKNEATGLYLHHNFVTRLLNDLFGIQTRSGCACAGPYAEYLLGISEELAEKYIQVFSHKNDSHNIEIIKPGFTRFSFPFFFDECRVDFVLEAIKFICEHGWKFLPQYNFSIESGTFMHVLKSKQAKKEPEKSLNMKAYINGDLKMPVRDQNNKYSCESDLKSCLMDAKKLVKSLDVFYETFYWVYFISAFINSFKN